MHKYWRLSLATVSFLDVVYMRNHKAYSCLNTCRFVVSQECQSCNYGLERRPFFGAFAALIIISLLPTFDLVWVFSHASGAILSSN